MSVNEDILKPAEQSLFDDASGGLEANLILRSKSKVDAGGWFFNDSLCLCFTKQHLYVVAMGRRQYVLKISYKDCEYSHYCHASGELVIAPIEDVTYRNFKLSPLKALRALNAMGIDISRPFQYSEEKPSC